MAAKREPEDAVIESVTHDGRGIAAVSGKKVFVAGALAGEKVRFIRRKRRRNFDEAELLEVLCASDARIEARCEVYGRCGGCSLQHVSPGDQRAIKEQSMRDSLERIGKVSPESWLPPLFNENDGGEFNYRRRARLAVKHVAAKGRVLVGFRERHAPFITDMHRCDVLAHPVSEMLDPLSDLIGGMSIRARLPQIEVAVADNVTTLVLRVLDLPSDSDIQACEAFALEHGVEIALQPGGIDSVAPLRSDKTLSQLAYSLPDFDVELEFSANDFVQINGPVNRRMVSAAIDLLQVGKQHTVADLYCGIGNFSLPIARNAGKVLGIEGAAQQVTQAAANAKLNGIENCEFRCADLEKIDGSEQWLSQQWDRVLLDPARSGALAIVKQMTRIGADRVVYVSCHPGTLARDAAELVHEQRYVLEAAGIIDMFPHTGHVESVAVFRKS